MPLSLELVRVENTVLSLCVGTLVTPRTSVSQLARGHHAWSASDASRTRLAVNISTISIESNFAECDFFVQMSASLLVSLRTVSLQMEPSARMVTEFALDVLDTLKF
jgi:hypothetical protein